MKRAASRFFRTALNLTRPARRATLPPPNVTAAALALVVLGCAAGVARGQNIQFTPGGVSPGLDHTMQIPLRPYTGRAGASLPVTLYYSSKVWRISYINTTREYSGLKESMTEAVYSEYSTAGWRSSLDLPRIEWPKESAVYDQQGRSWCFVCPYYNTGQQYRIARVYVHMPDGSTHELRKSDNAYVGPVDTSGEFYAVDGSRMRFDASGATAGTLYLPDGSRYVLSNGSGQFVDRNGNTLHYNGAARQWTDTLGRVVGLPMPATPQVGDFSYVLPGTRADTPYVFRWRRLADALAPGSPAPRSIAFHYLPYPNQPPTNTTGGNYPRPIQYPAQGLFYGEENENGAYTHVVGRGQAGSEPFDPVVLAEILLPDGTSYRFSYNIYGEIEKVVYPTGGYDRYVYEQMDAPGRPQVPYSEANRGVKLRQQSTGAPGAVVSEWRNSTSRGTYATGDLEITTTAPDNTRTVSLKHDPHPSPFGSDNARYWPFGYEDYRVGLTYDERVYAPNPDGSRGPMVRRKLTGWESSSQVIAPRAGGAGERVVTAYRNSRPNADASLLLDTAGNALVSRAAYAYDAAFAFTTGVEMSAVSEYDYAETDQTTAQSGPLDALPWGAALRTSETQYLTSDAAYRTRNLLGLPTVEVMKDGAGNVVARAETFYDEPAYAPLTYQSPVNGWADPQTAARGNVTTVRRFTNVAAGTFVETHARYDQCGSLRHSWDTHEPSAPGHGRLSQTEYSPNYHYAYPTRTLSPVPDPSGVYGSTTALEATTAYDLTTGLVASTTDAEGRVTTYSYADDNGVADPFLRLRKVTRPAGAGWTKYNYGVSLNAGVNNHFVETVTALDGARATSSYQFYDGLGRRNRTFNYVGPGAFDTTDTQYDVAGRVWRAALPYRTSGSGDAVPGSARWTTSTYDALGRLRTVTTTDGAVIDSSYSGNEVTVTDQAMKKKRTRTDALGRLARVVEDPFGVAYQTDYTYDAVGNLRRIAQGAQRRYYMYDALSRLVRVKNPEQDANPSLALADNFTAPGDAGPNQQWSLAFSYDQFGNLHQRVDARNISITYGYDNLNRNTTIRYSASDSAHATDRFYDNQPGAKGALWRTARAGDYTDVLDRDAAGRPQRNRQWFYSGLGWRYYDTTCTYGQGGQVTSQAYPSGHTVSYQYDAAGRTNDFRGTLGDGAPRVYSTGAQYDETGRMRQEQFGTQVPVYNKRFYNVRGQLSEIRVSTYPLSAPGQETNWNRGAIINHYSELTWAGSGHDNNGNLRKQDMYVPADDATSGYSLSTFFYYYDGVNRLDVASEVRNGANSWVQDYDYDRYGNRTVNPSQTWGGINSKTFAVDPNTNRLGVPAGQPGAVGYDSAGNLTADTYSAGASARVYDAESRLTRETNTAGVVTGSYSYDGDGRRVRRTAHGQETWYVYGMGGELVAEYAAGSTGASVRQEYGYRGGELLVTASPDGEQGLQADYYNSLDFTNPALSRTDPTVNFEWHGASPGGAVNPDIFTARWTGSVTPRYTETYTFYTQSDDGVRLWVNGQLVVDKWIDQGWTEWSGQVTLQAGQRYDIRMDFYERYGGSIAKLLWSSASQPKEVVPASQLRPPHGSAVKWLVKDQHGTPRMSLDQTGGLARMTRHDYLPFGEELWAGVGGRTTQQGYAADGTRQQFTGHERDTETGLDFMQARHYSGAQGRFASPDTFAGSKTDPQSLNLYAYVLNNPMRYTDPTGRMPASVGWSGVADGFWGGGSLISLDPRFGGMGIVWERMDEFDRNVTDTITALRLNRLIGEGKLSRDEAEQMIEGNDNLDITSEEVTVAVVEDDSGGDQTGGAQPTQTSSPSADGTPVPGSDGKFFNCFAAVLGYEDRRIDIVDGQIVTFVVGEAAVGSLPPPIQQTGPTTPGQSLGYFGGRWIRANQNCPAGWNKVKVYEDSADPLNWHMMARRSGERTWFSKNGDSFLYTNIRNPDRFYREWFSPAGQVTITAWCVRPQR